TVFHDPGALAASFRSSCSGVVRSGYRRHRGGGLPARAAEWSVRFRGLLPAQLNGKVTGGRRMHGKSRGALMVVLDKTSAAARVPAGLRSRPDPPLRIQL